jgi:predicted HTH transcriptional regulator
MIHENSLKAYIEEKEEDRIGRRQQEILKCIKRFKVVTAREIMLHLEYEDMNQVRPRLTELKELGLIREIDKTKCLWTGKTVSRFGLR